MYVRCINFVSLAIGLSALLASPSHSQDRFAGQKISAHWFGNNDRFWYRKEGAEKGREFIVVDATQGTKSAAFDHAEVAKQLGVDASKLPIENLRYSPDGSRLFLTSSAKNWEWLDSSKKLVEVTQEDLSKIAPPANAPEVDSNIAPRGEETEISIENRTPGTIELFWMEGNKPRSYGKIEAQQTKVQHTFGGHRWMILDEQGKRLRTIVASDAASNHIIDGTSEPRAGRNRRGDRSARNPDAPSSSSDWSAAVRNGNIILKNRDGSEVELTKDGSEESPYGDFAWSPDAKTLVAFRLFPGEKKEVHLVQSSPPGGGRAVLKSRPYSLPGDRFPTYELHVFDIDSRTQFRPVVDRFEHEWNRPTIRWSKNGNKFYYSQIDRGHQRFRLFSVAPSKEASEKQADQAWKVSEVIDEKTSTFIWTAHTEELGIPILNWFEYSDEALYVSEKSGYRHLYLIDAEKGREMNGITSGAFVVRGVDRIDEEKRQVWFRASGVYPDQDPYLVHYGRANFDGSGITWLTRADGTHSLQYSPDQRFVIDTYSRVDLPPCHELRRVADGSLVCELERMDPQLLSKNGWQAPEVFHAKGRDGETDIWGIICRPQNFDPNKKYPIIEDIYAGPQSAYVPKNFSPNARYKSLTDLGFIVVKIDGMGTANRSKAFHDVCWHNLKDAGFEDRIRWIRAAAARYAEFDLERVGIYGTSAGGQNAAGAVLFHPEFYKAAVAACGCHDNRMDKASWNEQWMGYPVGPHYAESSNIDNAHRLQGNLLLIVGEMDDNVPPESTLRLADALIRADKNFDLLVVPNAGHGMGGAYGVRRMHDFFVRHLKP